MFWLKKYDKSKVRSLVKIESSYVNGACYVGDDQLLVCNGSELKMWNIKEGTCVKDFALEAHAIHVTANRKLIAAFRYAPKIKMYDLDSNKENVIRLESPINEITSLENGTIVIRHSYKRSYFVNFYAIDELKLLRLHTIQNGNLFSCMEPLSESRLALGDSEGKIHIYSSDAELLRTFVAHESISSLRYSNYGSLLSVGDNKVKRWCIDTGEERCAIDFGVEMAHVVVLPDDHICVTTQIGTYGIDEKLVIVEMESEKIGSIVPTSCLRQAENIFPKYDLLPSNMIYLVSMLF